MLQSLGFFCGGVFTVTLFSGHSSPSVNCKKLENGLGRQGCLKDVYSFI